MPDCKCAQCGSEMLVKNGSRIDKTGKWQVYKCNNCGHAQKGELLKPIGGTPALKVTALTEITRGNANES